MNFEQYQREAGSKFKPSEPLSSKQARLLDWTIGVMDEAGEVAGVIKHHVFHKQPLDLMILAKEIGDVLWYLSAVCESTGLRLEDCAELNVAKLQHRHGNIYSHAASAKRREAERRFEDTSEYRVIKSRIMEESE